MEMLDFDYAGSAKEEIASYIAFRKALGTHGTLKAKTAPKPYDVKRILKSGNRTIVFWQDGTKTIVKRAEDEQDSDYAAFTAALAIKLYGSNSAVKNLVEKTEKQLSKKQVKAIVQKAMTKDADSAIDRIWESCLRGEGVKE